MRASLKGHAFAPDSDWQKDFEKTFPFEDTPDQIKATEDVKQDMEDSTPMDRLLCGDVGYGKTEVAMRAAFKAVMGNKQVAILVPTTILAEQHFYNIKTRLKKFPVTVGSKVPVKSDKTPVPVNVSTKLSELSSARTVMLNCCPAVCVEMVEITK